MPPAFDAATFVERHRATVWLYLRLLGCDAATADDLTQETFLIVLERPFEERSDAASRAFLRQTARHLWLSRRRDEERREQILLADAAEAIWRQRMPRESPEEYLAALRSCLDQLPDRAREAIELRYRDRLNGKAIAGRLGGTVTAANTLMHRAREILRKCIEGKITP